LIIAIMAMIIGYAAFRRITRPLVMIKESADRFATGDLDHRVHIEGSEEISRLAQTLNEMAEQLQERIHTITLQHNELEAVLENMLEGVFAMDLNERILRINRAAERILDVNAADARGRVVPEVIRSSDLQNFIFRLICSDGNRDEEIEIHSDDRWFQVHGTLLYDEKGEKFGGLVVLSDITRLKKLETIRRDFVANVSHELRTPITAVKGFIETLQDENYDSPEDAKKFLDIIARQTDRLNAIVTDLLELSRIEQEAETGGIELEIGNVKTVLQRAMEDCRVRAQEKEIEVVLDCRDDLVAPINAPLLEQSVTNLLDNAVNHSPDGAVIRLSARETEAEFVIEVSDRGCGIEPQHIPRLFERFYRVDKNRSRELGGTGLGLAIVKHIALAHRGTVSVESVPGAGSTFRIHLTK
jgi:two-component system phosphate regulon sensor histidine kinase PhoR